MNRDDPSAWSQQFYDLPVGASVRDQIVGQTEWGGPLYRTGNGDTYWFTPGSGQQTTIADTLGAVADSPWNALMAFANGLGDSVGNALAAPRNALMGQPVTNGNAFDLAGMTALGGATIPAQGLENLASRRANLYSFPTGAEVGNALGRSHSGGLDIEGRPLVARHVVGGAPERVREQSLPSEALAEIVQGQTGRGIEIVPRLSAGGRGDVGSLAVNRYTGQPLRLEVLKSVQPGQREGVIRHEVGHLIDETAGQIPTKGLSDELEALFHYGVEGKDRLKNRTLPKHLGYSGAEAPREYMAEALRQYMSSPDTMKARAPKTAARIREYVNANTKLMNMIQFNSLAGIGLSSGFLPSDEDDAGLREYLGGI